MCVKEVSYLDKSGGKVKPITELQMRTRKEVVEQMDLCCLVDGRTLESVTLVCYGGEAAAREMRNSSRETVFMPLIVWTRRNLCGGGRLRLAVEYVG